MSLMIVCTVVVVVSSTLKLQLLHGVEAFSSTTFHLSQQQHQHQYQRQHSYSILSPSLSLSSSSSSDTNYDHQSNNDNNNNNNSEINFLDNSEFDTDQKPRRIIRRKSTTNTDTDDKDSINNSYSNGSGRHHQQQYRKKKSHKPIDKNSKEYIFSQWGVTNLYNNNNNDNQQSTVTTATTNTPCPSTIQSVAKECYHAISSTLYNRNCLDPNIVSNARAVSIHDKRPVGLFAHGWPKGRDVGRLGVEIDHARFLLSDGVYTTSTSSGSSSAGGRESRTGHSSTSTSIASSNNNSSSNSRTRRSTISSSSSSTISSYKKKQQQHADLEGRALRRIVLLLASKLSQMPWNGLEDINLPDDDYDEDDNDDEVGHTTSTDHNAQTERTNKQTPKTKTRPVALYFNTLHQALQASSDLQLLQQISLRHNQDISIYQNIRILCLGQDTIPDDMILRKQKNNSNHHHPRRKWGASRELSSGTVNPKNGLILIIQPTDYTYESKPQPSPSIGTVQELQKLLSRASVNQIPAVVISPRLTEQYERRSTPADGIEQFSSYQKSSTYGGIEPPKGPNPWLLRDFIPPVYSWVGCALELSSKGGRSSSRPPSPLAVLNESKKGLMKENDDTNGRNHHHNHHHDNNDVEQEIECTYSYYSRVAMTQTVMESGHPWHLYAVENNMKVTSTTTTNDSIHNHNNSKVEKINTEYQYIASTNPHLGRPSKELLRDVLSEFI